MDTARLAILLCLAYAFAAQAPAQTFRTIAQLGKGNYAITSPTVGPDGNLYVTASVAEGTTVLQLAPPAAEAPSGPSPT